MTTEYPNKWRVVRRSTTTGRVLKVIASDLRTPDEAARFVAGFGQDPTPRTMIAWERQWGS